MPSTDDLFPDRLSAVAGNDLDPVGLASERGDIDQVGRDAMVAGMADTGADA